MKDIFELAKEEKEVLAYRQAELGILFSKDHTRAFVANNLYQATYSDKWGLREFTTGKGASLEEIIDEFCEITFGTTYEEVLKAWDNYLG